jgi:hypothetical protein
MEMMKRILLLTLLAAIHLNNYAQGRTVTGVITDNRGVPIVGPTICQINTSNCTVAGMNGSFTLQLSEEGEMSLKVECLGFNPVVVALDETTVYPLKITLTPMYLPGEMFSEKVKNNPANGIVSMSSLNLHGVFTDFSQFGPSIGTYNTDLMKYFTLVGPELGVAFSNIYTGLGMGLGYDYRDEYDTLMIDLNTSEYFINFGYSIVNSHRIRLTPLVSLRWLRFRLLNYSDERKISMTRYLEERDLDLRFNQAVAVAGLNLDYLMYTDIHGAGDYWSLGAFGGYAMKLNRKPWIYSRGNRIMTDDQIDLTHLTFGMSITFYISAPEQK